MSSKSLVRRLLATSVLLSSISVGSSCALADSDSAAHALAERFAGASKAAPSASGNEGVTSAKDDLPREREAGDAAAALEERSGIDASVRAQEEADMLARARAEARAAALAAAREAEAAHRAADEARRAADAARQQQQSRRQRTIEQVEREREQREAVTRAPVPSIRREPTTIDLESQRASENALLAERLRRARESRSSLGGEPALDRPSLAARGGSIGRDMRTPQSAERHVTVLLRMEPGDKGIRRFDKTADPMLCVAESCYISRGPDRPAERIERWQAFGPFVALGSRAGACNNSLGCVFRDVDLEAAAALIQPVDLRIVRHDRRQAREASADATCRMRRGRLACERTLSGGTWSAWVVPESLARQAGAAALANALDTDLPELAANLAGR